MDVEIITYANNTDVAMLRNLVKTLTKNKYRYTILGVGEKWEGFMTKIKASLSHVQSLPPKNIVAFIDGYDVFAAGPADELMAKYRSYGYPLVVGAETYCGANCTPLTEWWKLHKDNGNGIRYCNSGFYIGEAGSVAKALQYMLDLGISDDQVAFCEYINKHPADVMLDTEAKLVGNVTPFDFKDIYLKDGVFTMKRTGSQPSFIHVPGRSGDLMIRANYIGKSLLGKDYEPTTVREVWNEWSGKVSTFFERNLLVLIMSIAALWVIIIAVIIFIPTMVLPFIGLLVVIFAAFAMWYSKFFSPIGIYGGGCGCRDK